MNPICRPIAAAVAVMLLTLPLSAQSFATRVEGFQPGTGSAPGYDNPTAALGAPSTEVPGFPEGIDPVTPFAPAFLTTQLVSIGAGGSLTLSFDAPIRNFAGNSFGIDFLLFGNNGFTITNGNFTGGGITDGTLFDFDQPGESRVLVSADNQTYFELVAPAGAATRVDGLFPTDAAGNPHLPVNPLLAQADFAGRDLAGVRTLYAGSAGGTGFDLDWARAANGAPAALAEARYVRIEVTSGKVEIDSLTVVPEPATWTLGSLALFAVVTARRKGPAR